MSMMEENIAAHEAALDLQADRVKSDIETIVSKMQAYHIADEVQRDVLDKLEHGNLSHYEGPGFSITSNLDGGYTAHFEDENDQQAA
jgi:hypothetical protein